MCLLWLRVTVRHQGINVTPYNVLSSIQHSRNNIVYYPYRAEVLDTCIQSRVGHNTHTRAAQSQSELTCFWPQNLAAWLFLFSIFVFITVPLARLHTKHPLMKKVFAVQAAPLPFSLQ